MSFLGQRQVEKMQPQSDVKRMERLLREAEEAKLVIEHGVSVPIPTLEGIERVMGLLGKGYLLDVAELGHIRQLIESTQQLKKFMLKRELVAPRVSSYAHTLDDLEMLRTELIRCLRNGQVVDDATRELSRVRKEMTVIEERIKKRIDAILQKNRNYLQDSVVTMRGDRYVIPIKRAYRKQVEGVVLDESASGQTVFIEPAGIATLQQELAALRGDEEREVTRVLSHLTGLVENNQQVLDVNLDIVGEYDFLFAKAKYANEIGGRAVEVNDVGKMVIRGGKHPLLGQNAVPLDFVIGHAYRAMLITGPNTGGKTVSLKTVGLLSLMVQSGLLVPVQDGSSFPVFTNVLADIGDGQSIEQSLSTFSAHIRNVIRILAAAGPKTLILLDELASGTDPSEGIALSIAILEELYRRQTTIVATTHFNEIKVFAQETPGFQNARMEFDVETLQPLYQLRMGAAGSSYAFAIAQKLGLPETLVRRSQEIAAEKQLLNDAGNTLVPVTRESQGDADDREGGHERTLVVEQPDGAQNVESSKQRPVYPSNPLQIGDRVWIHPLKRSGIVFSLPDARGNVGLLVQKQKMICNVKRIAPFLTKDALYPEDYDLDIVLESKEIRKKRKVMNRKHVPGVSIDYPPR